jgi:hypothetical protein
LIDSTDDAIPDQNLAMAISNTENTLNLYEPVTQFNGYHWYDDLSCFAITGYHLTYPNCEEVITPGDHHTGSDRPVEMKILGEIGSIDKTISWECKTDILILGSEEETWIDDISLCITETAKLTRSDILNLLESAIFCPSDDAESGSYDEQERRFYDACEDLVIKMLETDEEANLNAVKRIVHRELYWLTKSKGNITIQIANGQIDVSGLSASSQVSQNI